MISKERYEYLLVDDRLVERRIRRPEGCKRWRFDLSCPTLVAVIEPSDRSFELRHGPAASDRILVDAVRYYQGLLVDPEIAEIGPRVPAPLAQQIGAHVEKCLAVIASQYKSFAEETDITGFLKGLLERDFLTEDDWRASVKAWTYTRRPKERDLGLDIGLLIDLLLGEKRVIKAMWFQAKRVREQPASVLDLPDLNEQLTKMRKHTEEAYGLIYDAERVLAYRGDSPSTGHSLGSVVVDGVLCRRGDRAPRVVALTGDARLVIETLVTGSES